MFNFRKMRRSDPECLRSGKIELERFVQCIANPIDSVGELHYYAGPTRARDVISTANAQGVGVMGIRAVQGGAFTDTLDRDLPADHGVAADYNRAGVFRTLAAERASPPPPSPTVTR